jgi:predicted DNA-binding ribbon-helix-helix protein
MKSTVHKHSILLGGHRTSVSLEDAFWQALKEVARENRVTVSCMADQIDKAREHHNLSSAIRLFVLNHYRSRNQPPVDVRAAA